MGLISDLQKLIRQPSISFTGYGIVECANLVVNLMNKAGIPTQILTIQKNNSKIAPLVYGEIKSKINPHGKTLLFYNHYDVQPIGSHKLWIYDPFSGIVKDRKIFGRGSADDKGELITRIKAVELLLRETGDVPCNIKFVVEGEEEIGSPNLALYKKQFSNKFLCDAIIWEFGYVDPKNRPIINLGMKGMLFVELKSYGASVDLHSSLAVIVKNPLWHIVKILNSIYDEKTNRILIKDWYQDIKKISKEEQIFLQKQPLFDEIEFKKKYNLSNLLVDRNNIGKSLSLSPTCNLSNISIGHCSSQNKTSIPSMATAKLDFRLVPNMHPEKQFKKLLNHLYLNKFTNIKVRYVHGISPSRTSFLHPFVSLIKKSAEKVFDSQSVINLSSAGSGPMSLMSCRSRIPCIAVGCTSLFSNIHSTNEFATLDLLKKGTHLMKNIIYDFSLINW